jgi:hypothetical protein
MSNKAAVPALADRTADPAGDPLPLGRVTHDDRGQAVWEWLVDINSTDVRRRLPELSVTGTEAASPSGAPRFKKTFAESGFNPYETGLLEKAPRLPKRDLRELSRWIEMRKRARGPTPD